MLFQVFNGFLMNVKINLGTLDDKDFATEARARMEKVLGGLAERRAAIIEVVDKRMGYTG